VASACSDDANSSATTTKATASAAATTSTAASPAGKSYAVGRFTQTFVDKTRGTVRNGVEPAKPDRTIAITYFYPATGDASSTTATENATPERSGGPYPLVEFSHGFTATPDSYKDALTAFAAAGYIVAAPTFPLSSKNAPGGPNAGDVFNQPADASFVITQTIDAAKGSAWPLAGLVDADRVGASGHSNGGITTEGLAFNNCCQDKRIKAALVLAGSPQKFPGEDDFANAPPVLFVHGTKDDANIFPPMLPQFNNAMAPKGFLQLIDEDHGSWLTRGDNSFDIAISTSITFFDAYLRGDAVAKAKLKAGWDDAKSKLTFATEKADQMTLPTVPEVSYDRKATVSPAGPYSSGQEVTVSWSGYKPGGRVNIVQCSAGGAKGVSYCELTKGKVLIDDPTGTGSIKLNIVVGRVGEGQCGAGANDCVLSVNDSALTAPEATISIPLTFK
jgi:dienelactone hydrolase